MVASRRPARPRQRRSVIVAHPRLVSRQSLVLPAAQPSRQLAATARRERSGGSGDAVAAGDGARLPSVTELMCDVARSSDRRVIISARSKKSARITRVSSVYDPKGLVIFDHPYNADFVRLLAFGRMRCGERRSTTSVPCRSRGPGCLAADTAAHPGSRSFTTYFAGRMLHPMTVIIT